MAVNLWRQWRYRITKKHSTSVCAKRSACEPPTRKIPVITLVKFAFSNRICTYVLQRVGLNRLLQTSEHAQQVRITLTLGGHSVSARAYRYRRCHRGRLQAEQTGYLPNSGSELNNPGVHLSDAVGFSIWLRHPYAIPPRYRRFHLSESNVQCLYFSHAPSEGRSKHQSLLPA